MTSLSDAIIAVILMALIILATRAFPFVLFSRADPPSIIIFIERFIPPMVMGVLVVYCLKDIAWTVWPSGLPELIALAVVALLQVWKKNAMLSIFGSTALYMLLIEVLAKL